MQDALPRRQALPLSHLSSALAAGHCLLLYIHSLFSCKCITIPNQYNRKNHLTKWRENLYHNIQLN